PALSVRGSGPWPTSPRRHLAAVLWLVPGTLGGAARLYTEEDPLVILSSGSLRTTVSNSSSAWLVQFFSSWCGHCIQYSGTWKALAGDVQEWQEAISVGVLDCAQEENFDVCKEFSIKFYPTFKIDGNGQLEAVGWRKVSSSSIPQMEIRPVGGRTTTDLKHPALGSGTLGERTQGETE
uniref:Quiescin sulfhydryl oxidase 2 n=1 Tax=Amphiprion percula TaxID=161767 RepID=A0A3P8U2L8_AMPPE